MEDLANLTNLKEEKTPVTVFELTVWAYSTHMVQYEVDRHPEFLPERWRGHLLDDLLGHLGRRQAHDGRGSINGAGSTAAEAAHIIHAHVSRLASSAVRHLIITAGARAQPPRWNPVTPPYRLIPDWKGQRGRLERIDGMLVAQGAFRKIWSKKGQWIGCRLRDEGTPPVIAAAIIEKARADYCAWHGALMRLEPALAADPCLADLCVRGIGAPAEPWLMRT